MSDRAGALPTLAYCYEPGSFATLALFGASRNLCRLLWVLAAADLDAGERRLLGRTGDVLEVTGLDGDGVAAAIAERGPRGILALADARLVTTAAIAERLGLRFHTVATASRLVDKLAQRSALRDAGLRSPGSWLLEPSTTDAEAASCLAAAGTPAVLKPRYGEASRDTVRVEGLDGLLAEVHRERTGPRRDLVLESFIPDPAGSPAGAGFAPYVSVESVVSDGVATHVGVNGRLPVAPPFRETGFFVPAALDAATEREVLGVATAAAAAVGVESGCLHTEVKLTPDGPTVIEVNGRIGGGVPELVAATSGVDLLRVAMEIALGASPRALAARAVPRGVAFLMYVHAPSELGVLSAVDGLEEVRALPGVREVVLRRGPGSAVDWREGNHGHVASVFGLVEDHDALRALSGRILATIRIAGA